MADGSYFEKNQKIAISLQPFDRFRWSLRHMTCFCARMCLLWIVMLTFPIQGVKSPKKPFWGREWAFSRQNDKIRKLAYSQNYSVDFNQTLHNYEGHQALFMGGPNTHSTNPIWRTAAILKKSKNCDISAAIWPISTINTLYHVFQCKDVPFVDLVVTISLLAI